MEELARELRDVGIDEAVASLVSTRLHKYGYERARPTTSLGIMADETFWYQELRRCSQILWLFRPSVDDIEEAASNGFMTLAEFCVALCMLPLLSPDESGMVWHVSKEARDRFWGELFALDDDSYDTHALVRHFLGTKPLTEPLSTSEAANISVVKLKAFATRLKLQAHGYTRLSLRWEYAQKDDVVEFYKNRLLDPLSQFVIVSQRDAQTGPRFHFKPDDAPPTGAQMQGLLRFYLRDPDVKFQWWRRIRTSPSPYRG